MIGSPVPTRAEVSDVATASSRVPTPSCCRRKPRRWLSIGGGCGVDRIAVDRERPALSFVLNRNATHPKDTADAIMAAVHQITHTIHARAVVCWTKSGSTGLRAARERPEAPIIVLTPLVETARRLALAWGLHCVTNEDAHDLDDVVDRAARIAFQEGFAKPGDRIVVTAGVPLGTPGSTNLLRVTFVGPTAD